MKKPYLYQEDNKTLSFLNGKDHDRIEYIRLIVEEELMSFRDDFILCQNEEGQVFYLHRMLSISSDVKLLTADEEEIFKRKLADMKLNEPAITLSENQIKDEIKKITQKHVPDRRTRKRTEKKPLVSIRSIIFLSTLLILSTVFYFFVYKEKHASIRIISEKPYKRVLLNKKPVPVSGLYIHNLPLGDYHIAIVFKDDTHLEKHLTLSEIKTYSVIFRDTLQTPVSSDYAELNIKTNELMYEVLVDSILYSSTERIRVSPGSHTIRLIKEGYIAEPAFRSVFVTKNESVYIPFSFRKQKVTTEKTFGSIEVKTNRLSAKIYLNGKPAPLNGNHTFLDLNYGTYHVQVIEKGYTSYPTQQKVVISKNNPNPAISFKLEKTSGNVSVTTLNALGTIYLDGKNIAKGQTNQILKKGSYTISFSEVEGFYTPKSQTIYVDPEKQQTIIGKYLPVVFYRGTFSKSGLESNEFTEEFGFVKHLTYSTNPERLPKLSSEGVVLSYPFEYNNPVAGHAIKLFFKTPAMFETSQKLHLYLTLKIGSETYSISNTKTPEISVFINNKRTFLSIPVKDGIQSFPINTLLKQDLNEILIFTTDNNNVPITLSKIEIRS